MNQACCYPPFLPSDPPPLAAILLLLVYTLNFFPFIHSSNTCLPICLSTYLPTYFISLSTPSSIILPSRLVHPCVSSPAFLPLTSCSLRLLPLLHQSFLLVPSLPVSPPRSPPPPPLLTPSSFPFHPSRPVAPEGEKERKKEIVFNFICQHSLSSSLVVLLKY